VTRKPEVGSKEAVGILVGLGAAASRNEAIATVGLVVAVVILAKEPVVRVVTGILQRRRERHPHG